MWWSLRRLALLVFLLLFALPNGDARKCVHNEFSGKKEVRHGDLAFFTEANTYLVECEDNDHDTCVAGVLKEERMHKETKKKYMAPIFYQGCFKEIPMTLQTKWKDVKDNLEHFATHVLYICSEENCREQLFDKLRNSNATGNDDSMSNMKILLDAEVRLPVICNHGIADMGTEVYDLRRPVLTLPKTVSCKKSCMAAVCQRDGEPMKFIEGCRYDVLAHCNPKVEEYNDPGVFNYDLAYPVKPKDLCFYGTKNIFTRFAVCAEQNCRSALLYCIPHIDKLMAGQDIDYKPLNISLPYNGMELNDVCRK